MGLLNPREEREFDRGAIGHLNCLGKMVQYLDKATGLRTTGAFGSSAAGNGIALSANRTAADRVYADDGGAAIGSGTFARAGVFRHLLTYTGGNREQEAGGVVGQLVSVGGTNRHNMAGTWGSYEAKSSLVVDGQAAAIDTWCQAAVLGRVGAANNVITINENGVLAGVAAMSNVATALAANNGVYTGLYVGKWSGTAKWGHGLYVERVAVTKGIQLGAYSSLASNGLDQNATTYLNGFFADDAGNAMTGDKRNLLARTLLTLDQSAAVTINAIRGHIKANNGIDISNTGAVVSPIRGYLELVGTGARTVAGHVAAIRAAVEEGASGTTTISGSSYYAGLEVTLNSSRTYSVSGTMAGIIIDTSAGSAVWPVGLLIDGSAATTGIGIGSCTTAGVSFTGGATTLINANATAAAASTRGFFIGEDSDSSGSGIPLVGAEWTTSQGNALYCDDGGSTQTGYTETFTARYLLTANVTAEADVSVAAVHSDLAVNCSYDGKGGLGASWGHAKLYAGKTLTTDSGWGCLSGGHFSVELAGTSTIAANSWAAGLSVGYSCGTITHTGYVVGILIRKSGGSVGIWDGALGVIDGDGVTQNAAAGSTQDKHLRVLLMSQADRSGTLYTIPMYKA